MLKKLFPVCYFTSDHQYFLLKLLNSLLKVLATDLSRSCTWKTCKNLVTNTIWKYLSVKTNYIEASLNKPRKSIDWFPHDITFHWKVFLNRL